MQKLWHTLTGEQTLLNLQSSEEGLSTQEAKRRLTQYGFNRLDYSKKRSLWSTFGNQFLSPLVLILIAAAAVKLITSNFLDGLVLAATILFMACIGFIQEMKAEKAIHALKKLTAHKTKVKRDGKIELISSEEVVVGDLVLLEMGTKISADARLLEEHHFKVNESMLSGESFDIKKQIYSLKDETSLPERNNMVYAGTIVTSGKAFGIVVATGVHTELGKIAQSLKEIKQEETPLQKNIRSLGNWMLVFIVCSIILFACISFYKGLSLIDIFFLGVAAAVSAVPEALPAAFTTTLACGMHLMARRNAIIRRLIAVETLGSTTVICCDKTGTLTLNQMKVIQFYLAGQLFLAQQDKKNSYLLHALLETASLCNDAVLPKHHTVSHALGDPTEVALLWAAADEGLYQEDLSKKYPRIAEIPFQSENLYMATLHKKEKGVRICVKGAPEKILAMSSSILLPEGKKDLDKLLMVAIEENMNRMTSQALRTIAIAECEWEEMHEELTENLFKGRLTFIGISGMMDPPRKEVMESIKLCYQAGVKVIMITGDNPVTAAKIASQIGIASSGVVTGKELEALDDNALQEKVKKTAVFARVEPIQKLKIVRALQASCEVVAMTGDGVNDAPALEAADIGIAMGLNGTDVAKEAADMILADDHFDSIVAAIEEGRAIFNRLRHVCTFLLTTCFGELLGLIVSVLSLGINPLTPLQIIWINLVSGSLIAIPLGFEPKDGSEMSHPPRHPHSKLVYEGMMYRIGYLALFLGLGVFVIFYFTFPQLALQKARTLVLTSLVAFEWTIAFHMRSEEFSLKKIGLWSNPSLITAILTAFILHLMILYTPLMQGLFQTTDLSLKEWAIVLLPAFFIFCIESLRKYFFPRLFSRGK